MDEVLYMVTIYNPDGKRTGLKISNDKSQMMDEIKKTPKIYGDNCTAKLWECHQIPTPTK